ncbi:Methyltransferase domain-containing protein [Limimonas halophila]|uniref:Methyltransferase domain-containing protein n=1 Tax=Limimonas halophila TaxID=1082479 RepID=A0A1G7PXS7_9PROT|nr:class I SAM-dependent methyltransferase [Limimonas halophila]SDF91056.1 Methyltransferase domain-containing protein [Limimonas halophila]
MSARGAPSPWVVRFAERVPAGGTVLDLACGRGRHAAFFLARGHPVTAVDRDTSGLADLAEQPGLEIVEADLEAGGPFPLAGRTFAGVVVTNYLHRPLLPALVATLAPGGVLIYETFTRRHAEIGRPRNPAFLLEPNELRDAVGGELTVLAFEDDVEEVTTTGRRVVQHICARRPG